MSKVFTTSIKPVEKPDGLISGIIENRHDICPYCKAQRVELFSFNGYPQNYRDAVDDYLKGYNVNFDKYEIRTMKCRACGKEFVIDWSMNFPKPLRSSVKTTIFLSEFISDL